MPDEKQSGRGVTYDRGAKTLTMIGCGRLGGSVVAYREGPSLKNSIYISRICFLFPFLLQQLRKEFNALYTTASKSTGCERPVTHVVM